MNNKIVPLTKQNTADAARLEEWSPDPWSPAQIEAELQNKANISLLLYCGAQAAAFCSLTVAGGEAALNTLVVHPALRRQGAAKALLQAAFAKAAGLGAKEIFLEVRESNHSAVCLYQKLGFVQAGVRRQFYSHPTENALVMRREMVKESE